MFFRVTAGGDLFARLRAGILVALASSLSGCGGPVHPSDIFLAIEFTLQSGHPTLEDDANLGSPRPFH